MTAEVQVPPANLQAEKLRLKHELPDPSGRECDVVLTRIRSLRMWGLLMLRDCAAVLR